MRGTALCLSLLAVWLTAGPHIVVAQSAIVFTHVSVIDGTDSLPRADQTVIIRGRHIVAVGPSRISNPPPNARVVDARGKFLIPGLWDMHVHTTVIGGRNLLGMYVANGVTGVRDMAGDWDTFCRRGDERSLPTGWSVPASSLQGRTSRAATSRSHTSSRGRSMRHERESTR